MTISWSIIAAGVLVAAAVLITNHWQITLLNPSIPTVVRLDRWSGVIDVCVLDPASMRNPNSFVGADVNCKAK